MRVEAQQVAIAESLGFEVLNRTAGGPKFLGRKKGYRDGDWSVLPNWRNDTSAAIQLCDELADKGWNCELNNGLDKTWECQFIPNTSHFSNPLEPHYGTGDTPSVAICVAYLRVKGLWKDEA